jgi:hypothetical protein
MTAPIGQEPYRHQQSATGQLNSVSGVRRDQMPVILEPVAILVRENFQILPRDALLACKRLPQFRQ